MASGRPAAGARTVFGRELHLELGNRPAPSSPASSACPAPSAPLPSPARPAPSAPPASTPNPAPSQPAPAAPPTWADALDPDLAMDELVASNRPRLPLRSLAVGALVGLSFVLAAATFRRPASTERPAPALAAVTPAVPGPSTAPPVFASPPPAASPATPPPTQKAPVRRPARKARASVRPSPPPPSPVFSPAGPDLDGPLPPSF